MEAKEICDGEILSKNMGKSFNNVTNLQSSLPEHEMDFPSLEHILILRQCCGLCTGIVSRLFLAGVMQVVTQGDSNGILYLWSYSPESVSIWIW